MDNKENDDMIEEEEKSLKTYNEIVGYGGSPFCGLLKIENIVKCASFWAHSLFLDVKGNVYGIGKNDHHQLGLNHNINVNIPQPIPINANIVDVAVGGFHSILLSDKGCIYTFGRNNWGQCGHENEYEVKMPLKCSYFYKMNIIKICAGREHSGVITSDNCAYLFGWNAMGQCGVPFGTNTKIPQKVLQNAKDIICGGRHTLMTSADDVLYACGNNGFGQIGNGTNMNQFGLEQIKLPHNVVGADGGCYHSLCVLSNGEAYVWGAGSFGQLGLGNDTSDKYVPTQIYWYQFQHIKFKKCVAGDYNSCLFDEDDNLYVFGRNDSGQLCVGDNENKNIPTKIQTKSVMDISMGNQYTFLLLFGKKQKKKKEEVEKKESEFDSEVEIWLCKELRLPRAYFDMFMEEGFDDMSVIIETLNETDLKEMEYQNVKIKRGHQRKIMLSVAVLRELQKNINKNDEIDQQIEGSQINLKVHQANFLDTMQ